MQERLLQALNGAAIVPGIAGLILLGIYMSRESRRRGLRSMDWFRLPPSMNLVLAMFIFDVGVCARVMSAWIWFMTGEQLKPLENLFSVAIFLIIVGSLCKIRALTAPDHGNLPWILLSALTAAAIILLFVF